MRVAVLGGTGDLGEGLVVRWGRDAPDLGLVVGSRDAERAADAAAAYRGALRQRGGAAEPQIEGAANAEAATDADVVVLSVPPGAVTDTLDSIGASAVAGTVLISPAVAMRAEGGNFRADPPPAGSVTELVADATPADAPVAGAYHTLPAGRLADLDRGLEMDVPVAGDAAAVRTAFALTEPLAGLRPLRVGGVGNAPELEALTPLLLNLARHDERIGESGVRFG
jgi:hypothetical protein